MAQVKYEKEKQRFAANLKAFARTAGILWSNR